MDKRKLDGAAISNLLIYSGLMHFIKQTLLDDYFIKYKIL